MRSGKDTIADYMIENYDYTRFGFAQALKEEVARGVGCTVEELNAEPLRTQVRTVLQVWGTEFRRAQDPYYWTEQADTKIRLHKISCDGPIVFTDVRFSNEIQLLRLRGFIIIKIDMSVEDVLSYQLAHGEEHSVTLARLAHASESEWKAANFDAVITSVRGDIQGLYNAIECVVEEGARGHVST